MDFLKMERTRKNLQRDFAVISGRINNDAPTQKQAQKQESKKETNPHHYSWFVLLILQFFKLN